MNLKYFGIGLLVIMWSAAMGILFEDSPLSALLFSVFGGLLIHIICKNFVQEKK